MLELFTKTLSRFFGSKAESDLKVLNPILENIKAAYENIKVLTNDELRNAVES